MEENPDYVRGDLTGDNYLNNADVMALMWHVLFPETHPISDTVDYDHNGQADNNDVIALMWYILCKLHWIIRLLLVLLDYPVSFPIPKTDLSKVLSPVPWADF